MKCKPRYKVLTLHLNGEALARTYIQPCLNSSAYTECSHPPLEYIKPVICFTFKY